MNLAKFIIMGLVCGIFNIYPVSYNTHILIFQNLFNTKIFDDCMLISLMNISSIFSILLLYRNDILLFFNKFISKSKNNKHFNYKKIVLFKYVKCLFITIFINVIIYLVIPNKVSNIKHLAYFYIVTSIILLFTRGNDGTKRYYEISYFDAVIIGLSSLLSFIPTIPICLCNLLSCTKQKINKKTSLRYSLTCLIPILFIDSIPGVLYLYNDRTYILEIIICFTISIIVSSGIYKSLKYMYYTNKLYRLAFYTLLFAIFIFYWFV